MRFIQRESPIRVINAAAYTAVDKAEDEVQLAFRINRDGANNIAHACKMAGAKMLHVSTDFVFDGTQSTPYLAASLANPVNVYGASKQAGDEAVINVLGDDCAIVRTSWVYSSHGNNFVKTMLRLMSEKEKLGIIVDQVGTPTWTNSLARAAWKILELRLSGIYNWSDSGVASWCDFAVAIQEDAFELGMIDQRIPIEPISVSKYPLPAKSPGIVLWINSSASKSWGTLLIIGEKVCVRC